MKKVFNLIIVDESGSMSVIREQAFSGMNETLSTIRSMQKKYPDTEQHVTLITFDSDHMKWHYDDVLADHTHELSWKATVRVRPPRCTTPSARPSLSSMPRWAPTTMCW